MLSRPGTHVPTCPYLVMKGSAVGIRASALRSRKSLHNRLSCCLVRRGGHITGDDVVSSSVTRGFRAGPTAAMTVRARRSRRGPSRRVVVNERVQPEHLQSQACDGPCRVPRLGSAAFMRGFSGGRVEWSSTGEIENRPRPVKWCTRLSVSSSLDVYAAAAISITSSCSLSGGSVSAFVIDSALM